MSKILIFAALIFVGCIQEPNVPKTKATNQIDNNLRPIDIVVIDSCEYIYGNWGYATVLTHKGNCKHCKQINSK